MPVLTSTNDLRQAALPTSGYGYSATRLDELGAAEYTLVSIVCDASGSVAAFRGELENALKSIVQACQFSPRADNLLLRLVSFDDDLHELHGFKLLERCNLSDYNGVLRVGGSTALYDAAENAVSATADYAAAARGQRLRGQRHRVRPDRRHGQRLDPDGPPRQRGPDAAVAEEALESMLSVLIGVNVADRSVGGYLQDFKTDVGFTQYVEIGRADAKTLSKLADFVSRSISAQSRSLGTGGGSQSLTF